MPAGATSHKHRRVEARKGGATGGKRRRKPPRSAPPAEIELDAEALEFIAAIERYRKVQSRPFPSWSEVLHVLRSLGYRKA